MEKIRSFKDLRVWQEAHKLVILIYKLTKTFPKDETFGLVAQMRRAAVSITSNIAEGFSRYSSKEKGQFYAISHGSLTELENQLLIAKDVRYIDENSYKNASDQLITVHRLLNAFIKRTDNLPNSKFQILNSTHGQILIEVVVAAAIIMLISVSIAESVASSVRGVVAARDRTKAIALSQEITEAMRAVTLEDWHNISGLATTSANIYHPIISGGKWVTASGNETISLDGISYTRDFWIDEVYRSATSSNIVASGGVWDPSTKKITTSITWSGQLGSSQSFNQSIYLSRFGNNNFLQNNWQGGPAGEAVITAATTSFATSTNINYASSTSITIQTQ